MGPWHVYDNPHEPHLCDYLSLARYIFTYPQSLVEGRTFFEVSNHYARYAKQVIALFKYNMDDLKTMGYLHT